MIYVQQQNNDYVQFLCFLGKKSSLSPTQISTTSQEYIRMPTSINSYLDILQSIAGQSSLQSKKEKRKNKQPKSEQEAVKMILNQPNKVPLAKAHT
jgi:hypothetical protein